MAHGVELCCDWWTGLACCKQAGIHASAWQWVPHASRPLHTWPPVLPPTLLPLPSHCTVQIFTRTCDSTRRIALMLRNLGFGAVPIHGQRGQPKRLAALNKFKAGERNILVATDVASRGIDIPGVDVVINYDVPQNSKVRGQAGRGHESTCTAYFFQPHTCAPAHTTAPRWLSCN